ncbi:MAG: hypothetical protein RJA25_1075 [Bacteroidota bacterium]|jgi:arylsulfatase A-like enzyme
MNYFISILFCILFLKSGFSHDNNSFSNSPNVILILADDLGYGDLSCYGQTKFQTPNIDALTKDGMLFTQHYSGAPVCAPSRAAILTAKHIGHTTIRGNKKGNKYGDFPLSEYDTTLTQLFKSRNYTTGVFGKWGVGYPGSSGDISKKGVDVFFGYYSQLAAHNYYPEMLWSNDKKVFIPENKRYGNKVYAPNMIHDSVMIFLERNKNNPFFLYIPTIIPHAELVPPDSLTKKYKNLYGTEKPYKGIKTIRFATKYGAYGKQLYPKAAYAAMMELLDKQVGEIVAKLKEEKIYNNTIIIFTSDNGAHKEGGAQPDFFNSNNGLRGYKRDLYEGGIRIPLIVHWPDKINKGSTPIISANWDIMPTLAEIIQAPMPTNTDGISLCPTLFQLSEKQTQHPYLYWEFHENGGKQAIRMGKWKVIKLNVNSPYKSTIELYDLDNDVAESNNLAEKHPEIVKQLLDLMNIAHTPNKFFSFRNDRYR